MYRCKILFLICFTAWFAQQTHAQSIDLSASTETRDHANSVFRIGDHSVVMQENVVKFLAGGQQYSGFLTYGISPDYSTLGFLRSDYEGSGALLLDSNADTLITYAPSAFERDDPSLAIFPFADGRSIVRQNIGRFAVYSALGDATGRYSSVSGSEGGETMSRIATDRRGETIVLYNPKVIRNGRDGSRAHLAKADGELNTFYSSADRTIEQVRVTHDGQFIGLLTANSGTNRQVLVYDRHGNQIFSMKFEDTIVDFSLSDDARFLLVYSESRALAFDVLTGEKKGSTSFRSSVVHAEYFPDDHLILALTGQRMSGKRQIRNAEFHAVHLQKREITSAPWSGSLGIHPRIDLEFRRTAQSRYQVRGTSKEIDVSVGF